MKRLLMQPLGEHLMMLQAKTHDCHWYFCEEMQGRSAAAAAAMQYNCLPAASLPCSRCSPPAWCHKLVKGWLDKAHVLLNHTADITPAILHIALYAPTQAHVVV